MNITKCKNGYILDLDPENRHGEKYVTTDIHELFIRMLAILENKTELGDGKYYGKVIVKYDDLDEDDF
jgi:hypothetical protein